MVVMVIRWLALLSVCGATMSAQAQAQAPPPLVVETDPLSPAEQRTKFHLPPGFEIQLVASEPDIGQPMNLNFDARGRLWVSHSVEYPWPAAGEGVEPREERFQGGDGNPPRDRITVFSGIGPDGRATQVSHYIDGLNIPIGQTPLEGGAIVYSIPNIVRWEDASGNRPRQSQVLYGPWGNVDTHGMVNSFNRWIDGWIYACHGFRNTSNPQGAAGQTIALNSGNTFRFRPDGSAIEQYTWGQVNPFGLTIDPRGNLYNADCHSMPITSLLRGATYQSFGKPHDGLGFGPDMIDHNHGSTGICGVAWYRAPHFPPDWQDNVFICNPVTGRVHRDRLEWQGSSPHVDSQPDFLTCEDGWFRPVDVKLGPDGALYVADFYNAIIGHYEVPLQHPRRDREKGRIWRIVYRGEDGRTPAPAIPDLASLSADDLASRLGDPNLTVRVLATNHLVDRGRPTLDAVRRIVADPASLPEARAHGAWVIERLGGLADESVVSLAHDKSPLVRVHAARLLAERPNWSDRLTAEARMLLTDADPFVQRAAAEALGRHPAFENLPLLLERLAGTDAADTHLRHVLRIALRDHLRDPEVAAASAASTWPAADQQALADVSLAVATPAAAWFLLATLDREMPAKERTSRLQHIARYADAGSLPRTLEILRHAATGETPREAASLQAIAEGLARRGERSTQLLGEWGRDLARRLIDEAQTAGLPWTYAPLPGRPTADNPFVAEVRVSADGDTSSLFFGSLPRGEQQTGVLRSETFDLPESLSFYMAGHDGFPNQPPKQKNLIQIRDAQTHAILEKSPPPRNDIAQRMEWNLSRHAGRRGYIEIIDDDNAGAYAWLAVGRFSISRLNPQSFSSANAACELMTHLSLVDLRPDVEAVVASPQVDLALRMRFAQVVATFDQEPRLEAMLAIASVRGLPEPLVRSVCNAVCSRNEEQIAAALKETMQVVPDNVQAELAGLLAGSRAGAGALLALIEAGHASARLLSNPALAETLKAVGGDEFAARVSELTAALPPQNDVVQQLIAGRRKAFTPDRGDAANGAVLFRKACAACHRIGEEGQKIAPQLDGVGNRGFERIVEDILDPNRNVDGAFRTTSLVLDSGKILTGLFRREEGETLIFADAKGEEFSVPRDAIEEQQLSPLSLMPSNVAETMTEAEFYDLLRFLLDQRATVDAAK